MAGQFKQLHESGYWRKSLWLVLACLTAWLLATLVPLALAQMGVQGTVLGWPLVFAMAAFGVPLVYLVIIAVYSLVMDRLDSRERHDQLHQAEAGESQQSDSVIDETMQ